jgi:hypothetical protein
MSSKLVAGAVQPDVLQGYEQECVAAVAQLAEAMDDL